MAFAARVRRARRRRCCEARFSAAALSRASSSAAARAFASALDAVPSEPVELVRTGTAPKLPRHAASSKGLRGSSVRREAGDGAPVDVRGVMPLTVAALAVSTCSRACAISPSARSSARSAASSADAALRRRTEASRRQLREKSSIILALYELQEVIEDAAGEGSRGRFGRIIHYRPLKLALALGALAAAGVELSEDLRPGAHHGVALLAGVLVVKTCVSIWEAK